MALPIYFYFEIRLHFAYLLSFAFALHICIRIIRMHLIHRFVLAFTQHTYAQHYKGMRYHLTKSVQIVCDVILFHSLPRDNSRKSHFVDVLLYCAGKNGQWWCQSNGKWNLPFRCCVHCTPILTILIISMGKIIIFFSHCWPKIRFRWLHAECDVYRNRHWCIERWRANNSESFQKIWCSK